MLALLFVATLPSDCLTDLNFLPTFLAKNDPGATPAIQQKGQALFDRALADARAKAATVTDDKGCRQVLLDYLHTYRAGHFSIGPVPLGKNDAENAPKAPSFRTLSETTALIVVPSFSDDQHDLLQALLDKNAAVLASHPNLLIDIRNNDGGSDFVYAPLIALIESNMTRDIGVEFLATPENVKSAEATCAIYAPTSEHCKKAMAEIANAMRKAPAGSYVRLSDKAITIDAPKKVTAMPKHVGLLIDKPCGSSCEEFVLQARQSFKVKLFGRATYGCLDYSNVRPMLLPSGQHYLFYATSRSLRLPYLPVDIAGIAPDQYLPKTSAPDDDIVAAQAVLESIK